MPDVCYDGKLKNKESNGLKYVHIVAVPNTTQSKSVHWICDCNASTLQANMYKFASCMEDENEDNLGKMLQAIRDAGEGKWEDCLHVQ